MYQNCSCQMVPPVRVELTCPLERQILSLLRLPFRQGGTFFAKVPPCVTISYSYANENTRKRLRSICLPTSKARIEDYNPSREETVITFTIDLC